MFGCSETFHRNRETKSRKRWWLAGYVCMMQLICAVQHGKRMYSIATQTKMRPYRLSRHDMSEAGSCMWP
jgi:hypothetical protein